MSGLLAPTKREHFLGNAEILEVFNISKIGKVAGCRVTEGRVERGAAVRLIRDNVVIHEGKLSTLKRFKDEVKDVRSSERLTESAVCLVADESDLDMHLERMLKQHKQLDAVSKRILEINPKHPLILGLAERVGGTGAGEEVEAAAHLLLDQALILEGEALPDPGAFARRLSQVMAKGFGS